MSDHGTEIEADWGDVPEDPQPRRAIPIWMGFCGCGCLVIILAVLAMAWMGVSWVNDGRDAELQWQELEQALPYGERPAGYTLEFGQNFFFLSFRLYLLTSSESDLDVAVMVPEDSEDGRTIFNEAFNPGNAEEELQLEVSGKSLRALWIQPERAPATGIIFSPQEQDIDSSAMDGRALSIEVPLASPGHSAIVTFHQGGDDPDLELVREFLRTFEAIGE